MIDEENRGNLCWNCGNLGKCPRLEGFNKVTSCKNFSKMLNTIEICKLLNVCERTFYRNCKYEDGIIKYANKLKELGYNFCFEKNEDNDKYYYYAYKVTI